MNSATTHTQSPIILAPVHNRDIDQAIVDLLTEGPCLVRPEVEIVAIRQVIHIPGVGMMVRVEFRDLVTREYAAVSHEWPTSTTPKTQLPIILAPAHNSDVGQMIANWLSAGTGPAKPDVEIIEIRQEVDIPKVGTMIRVETRDLVTGEHVAVRYEWPTSATPVPIDQSPLPDLSAAAEQEHWEANFDQRVDRLEFALAATSSQ